MTAQRRIDGALVPLSARRVVVPALSTMMTHINTQRPVSLVMLTCGKTDLLCTGLYLGTAGMFAQADTELAFDLPLRWSLPNHGRLDPWNTVAVQWHNPTIRTLASPPLTIWGTPL